LVRAQNWVRRVANNLKQGGYIVFAEHRYYGQSLPFGQYSFTNQNISFLTVEQALADYAQLIPDLKCV
jgi:lauroyl/myristoyl acyltransferase